MDLTLSQMNLMQMMVFIRTAKENSFSETANQLHMTQSAVSKSISRLEKELNLKLFERTTRRIELTPAGKYLYTHWQPLIEAIQKDYIYALELSGSHRLSINIGTTSTTNPELYFWSVADRFKEQYPNIGLNIESDSMDILFQKFSQNKYDIIFMPHFEHYTLDNAHIPWKWTAKDFVYAYMPSTHPLAAKKNVTLQDLAQTDLMVLDEAHNPNYVRDLNELFASEQLTPHITRHMPNAYTIKTSFRTASEIIIADAYFDFRISDTVCRRPIPGHYNGIICAWHPGNTVNESVQHFLDTI